MVTRRLSQVATSDDEGPPKPSSSDEETLTHHHNRNSRRGRGSNRRSRTSSRREPPPPPKRRKKVRIPDEDEDEDEELEEAAIHEKDEDEDEVEEEEEEEEEAVQEDAKPIGDVIRVSGKGRGQKKHYKEFEFDGNRFQLEDPVLLTPEDKSQKPYVAIIKDITQCKGNMMVTGQWFYRPEEADRKGGGSWQARDTRELFYSFHRDDVPAESVMHKCVVHFVPLHKQLPNRKQHPGFIVQKVYDTVERKLWKLTDKDYEDGKQEEIDVLVQKTISRLGDLPDIELEDTPTVQLEELVRNKRMLRKRHISPLDVSREDEGTPKSPRAETPGSCLANASRYYTILAEAKALTKDRLRDRWLEKLLQGVEPVCSSVDNVQGENKGTSGDNTFSQSDVDKDSLLKGVKGNSTLTWPDSAISAVVALEKASHETFISDFSKYNQKMRQLLFNLKGKLAQRLLSGELEPSKILSMTPTELKEGLTTEEIARNQPEEAAKMQMTDALCKRCNERKVGLVDIIQAGHGDRYQLECVPCGHIWYASRDEAAMLTIDGPSSVTSVGTAPWATTKFENVEKKKMVSPRDADKADTVKKSIEGSTPMLETQKSFNKSKADGITSPSPRNPE